MHDTLANGQCDRHSLIDRIGRSCPRILSSQLIEPEMAAEDCEQLSVRREERQSKGELTA